MDYQTIPKLQVNITISEPKILKVDIYLFIFEKILSLTVLTVLKLTL